MYFFIFKFPRKALFLTLVMCLVVVGHIFALPAVYASSPKSVYTVVVDAGHGGIDGGSVGVVTKNSERELNLTYANDLKSLLEKSGIRVVMTRTTLDGLYSDFAPSKKKDDMKKRKEIIERAKPNVVVSIHMNSFNQASAHGSQVFYRNGNEEGLSFATMMQKCFVKNVDGAKLLPKSGDYYMLNCSSYPSVLIECGYLSNPEEDRLLATKEHREKIVYSIFEGILNFLNVQLG